MNEKKCSTNNCNPCLNCGQDVCDNLKLHNLGCHELPQDGESFGTYKKKKLNWEENLSVAFSSLLIWITISFVISLFGGGHFYEIFSRWNEAIVAIYILLMYLFNMDMKGELNLYYTRDKIVVSNKVRIVKTSDRFFLMNDCIVYDGIRYKVAPRFRKHPEKLVAFLNAKQREWKYA